jgi:hypothetical protein
MMAQHPIDLAEWRRAQRCEARLARIRTWVADLDPDRPGPTSEITVQVLACIECPVRAQGGACPGCAYARIAGPTPLTGACI